MKHAPLLGLIGLLIVAAHPRAQSPAPVVPTSPSEARAAFLRLLDRPRVPLDVRPGEVKPPARGVIAERLNFATERHPDGSLERVPALVVRPDWAKPGDRMPAVLVLHGTGGRKGAMWPWLEMLAHRGFVAIAIDGRFHGERAGGRKGASAYNEAITRAWRDREGAPQTHPLYYDTCWDVWRTVDYLQTRPDVDPERIGMIGISKGGIETWLAGAVDDRIKVAVPAIAVQSFAWSLEHDRWQGRAATIKEAHDAAAADLGKSEVDREVCRTLWSKILPGILDQFDAPSMLRLFAGRPLLILNGERDPNCPIGGVDLAVASARAAFKAEGAEDHLKVMIAPGSGHTLTSEQRSAALDWFVVWLKPAPPPFGAARYQHFRALAGHRPGGGYRPGGPRNRPVAPTEAPAPSR